MSALRRVKDSIKVYDTAKSTMTNLQARHLRPHLGRHEADEVKRKAIIDGLENTLDFVQMLDNYADDLLDIGGDWTEGSETWPMLEDVLVVPAARAPGDERPPVEGAVKKRPQNDFDDHTGPAHVKLSFEDGQQAFDAPVTAAEIEDNTQRLLDFLNDDDTSHDVVAEVSWVPRSFSAAQPRARAGGKERRQAGPSDAPSDALRGAQSAARHDRGGARGGGRFCCC